jgi:hypothetical protein
MRIVSNRETQVILKFWERLHETMDTHLNFSSAYYPQTDGQTERINQILEDIFRASALQYKRSWNKSLSYIEFSCNNSYQESLSYSEFSCNNSYQESLKVAPFEMLYGRRCRTSLFWNKAKERKVFGPDVLQGEEKQVCMVRENL